MKRIISLALTAILAACLLTGIPSCKKTTDKKTIENIENTKWTASDSNGQYNLEFLPYQHEVELDVEFNDAPGYLIRGTYEVDGNRVLITYTNFIHFGLGANLPKFPLKASAEFNKDKLDYIHQQGDIVLDIVFTRVK